MGASLTTFSLGLSVMILIFGLSEPAASAVLDGGQFIH
jgi:hypothetical protein